MSPQHFKFCLSRLGWNIAGAATELGESDIRVMAYWSGREVIPRVVARYLDLRLKLKELSDA